MKNLESHGIYNFNFQALELREDHGKAWKSNMLSENQKRQKDQKTIEKMTEKSKTDLKTLRMCQAAEIGESRERIHPEKLGWGLRPASPKPLPHL